MSSTEIKTEMKAVKQLSESELVLLQQAMPQDVWQIQNFGVIGEAWPLCSVKLAAFLWQSRKARELGGIIDEDKLKSEGRILADSMEKLTLKWLGNNRNYLVSKGKKKITSDGLWCLQWLHYIGGAKIIKPKPEQIELSQIVSTCKQERWLQQIQAWNRKQVEQAAKTVPIEEKAETEPELTYKLMKPGELKRESEYCLVMEIPEKIEWKKMLMIGLNFIGGIISPRDDKDQLVINIRGINYLAFREEMAGLLKEKWTEFNHLREYLWENIPDGGRFPGEVWLEQLKEKLKQKLLDIATEKTKDVEIQVDRTSTALVDEIQQRFPNEVFFVTSPGKDWIKRFKLSQEGVDIIVKGGINKGHSDKRRMGFRLVERAVRELSGDGTKV